MHPFFVSNLKASVILRHCLFNKQYPSYHQILNFFCQKYWFCHSELICEVYKKLFRVMNTATELEPTQIALPLKYELRRDESLFPFC